MSIYIWVVIFWFFFYFFFWFRSGNMRLGYPASKGVGTHRNSPCEVQCMRNSPSERGKPRVTCPDKRGFVLYPMSRARVARRHINPTAVFFRVEPEQPSHHPPIPCSSVLTQVARFCLAPKPQISESTIFCFHKISLKFKLHLGGSAE